MAEAREVMDQITTVGLELEAAAEFLASDVVAVTPDVGQIEGRERCVDHWRQFLDAFPDRQFESRHKDHPAGNMHAYIGFPEIRKLEEEFLPREEVLAKYEGSVGFQP